MKKRKRFNMSNMIVLSGYVNFPKEKENGGLSFSLTTKGGVEGKEWGNIYVACTETMLKNNGVNVKKLINDCEAKKSVYITLTGMMNFSKNNKFTNWYISAMSIAFHDQAYFGYKNKNSQNSQPHGQNNYQNQNQNRNGNYQNNYNNGNQNNSQNNQYDEQLPFM